MRCWVTGVTASLPRRERRQLNILEGAVEVVETAHGGGRVLLLLADVIIGAQEMTQQSSRRAWRATQARDSTGGIGVHRIRLVVLHGESMDASMVMASRFGEEDGGQGTAW